MISMLLKNPPIRITTQGNLARIIFAPSALNYVADSFHNDLDYLELLVYQS